MAKKSSGGDKSKSAPPPAEHWGEHPQEHDYPAAAAYLSLICGPADAKRMVADLQKAPTERRMAKDLLRASRLALLPPDNPHVASDLAKVKKGTPLSPVLLVRGDVHHDLPLTVADGYHRICASYHLDENAAIPCRMAESSATRAGTSRTSATRKGTTRTSVPARPRSPRG
jgi:hypothetical protein